MARKDGQAGSSPPPEAVQPGTLTALLQRIAQAPEVEQGGAWDAALRPGAVVGRFELVKEIGRGGFGVVWEAKDKDLGRSVAFKAVRAGGRTAVREERLLREAEAAARLSHPNLVTLFDLGRSEHGPYLVLELLQGQTLEERLAQGSLSVREAVRIAAEVAKGVAHAHAQGVVHRDLKPGNVFLCDDGQVKVLDFGLAHAFGQRRQDGGTPAYMAPEQWEGAPEDERTDVFALGVMLHRMLSGELPFPDDGGKAVQGAGRAPAMEVAELPALGELVSRMLAKRPVDRPRDGGEVAAALRSFQQELERTPSTGTSSVRTRRRPGLRLAGWIGAAIAVGALVAGGVVWRVSRSPPAVGPDGRIVIAVADFANETSDPELDGLSEVLVGWLEQSRTLRVLTRGRLAALVREAGQQPRRIDEELARQVGGRAGVEVLLLGSIRRLGESYAVEVRAVEPAGDHYLFALPERAGAKEELFAALERLSERVRERLRERPQAIQASKVKVDPLTRSFEAWKHYRQGMAKADEWDYGGALQDFQRALAVDPDFALAHLRIAEHGEWVGRPVEERRLAMQAAIRNMGALPAKERLLVEAWRAHLDGREDEAGRLHAGVLEAYPQDLEVLNQAIDLHFSASRWEEALPLLRRLHALDRAAWSVRFALWECLGALDLGAERLALARTWADQSPEELPRLVEALGDAGEFEEAIAVARRATDRDDRRATRFAWAQALLRAGRYQDAEGALRPLVDPTRTGGPSVGGLMQLAAALDYQGRHREAMATVASIPIPVDRDYHRLMHAFCLSCRLAPGEARRLAQAVLATDFHANEWLPLHLLMQGEDREAAALAGRFGAGGQGMRQYRGLLAWKQGERERARAEMEALARRAPSYARPSAVYLLATFAREERRDRDVVGLVETLGRAIPTGWHAVAYPEALLWAAQAHERLGQREQARARIERLLGAWARADADLPLLAEARELCRKVGCRAPSRPPTPKASP